MLVKIEWFNVINVLLSLLIHVSHYYDLVELALDWEKEDLTLISATHQPVLLNKSLNQAGPESSPQSGACWQVRFHAELLSTAYLVFQQLKLFLVYHSCPWSTSIPPWGPSHAHTSVSLCACISFRLCMSVSKFHLCIRTPVP